MHLEGGHQALDSTGYLGFLYGFLDLAWGHLGCNSVHARQVDPMEYMA
jgi:hypothetical protein